MATIDELKRRVDLHQLADWLGMKRGPGGAKANYHAPHRSDANPSVSLFKRKNSSEWAFKDHADGAGGSCVDLVMYARGCDTAEAIRLLHEFCGLPMEPRGTAAPAREKSRAEYIADRCFAQVDRAIAYLQGRSIPTALIRKAIDLKAVGFNDWHSDTVPAGEPMHGGPAVAFITRSLNPGHVVAVDMRYVDPKLNGGLKTQAQGEKHGYGWYTDLQRLKAARTVYVVESPINALSVEACDMPFTAAFATRGVSAIEAIDWRWFAGKQLVLCFDNDETNEQGKRPGPEAAWKLHELLTGMDISALLVDQESWTHNDVNDILKEKGIEELNARLKKIEPYLIPGLPTGDAKPGRKRRVFLPGHDFYEYQSFEVKPDFTQLVVKKTDESGKETESLHNLAGFRVAGISRVTIASATSTMTGDPDAQPRVMFAVSVQTPRHGARLVRAVLDDDKLHNLEVWNKLGPVFKQTQFRRMVNILERTADLGARKAANFVGLCWRDGRLIVNEGKDCFFQNPEQQCPYHNLAFPSGSAGDARRVISAYQATFKANAAAQVIVWGLGGHLKALLGFWPHMTMQAAKGSGKSTLTKHLERTIGMTMLSGQSIETPFRIVTALSSTSHPVGWEELSARQQKVIDFSVSMLQEAYQYTTTRRGAELTEYLIAAPVLLAGEDVPVRSLIGKLVATDLTGRKGAMLPHDLPRFPVRQWLEYLSQQRRARIHELLELEIARCNATSRASGADDGAVRMVRNYAALHVAWQLLCEFAEIDPDQGGFVSDLTAQMNNHIRETSGDREPWVWIMEILFSQIATGSFRHPYTIDKVQNEQGELEECLLVRTSHVMDHLSTSIALRDKWNMLTVKSDIVFKRGLKAAGVFLGDTFERSIGGDERHGHFGGKRVSHLSALSLTRMARFGLHAIQAVDVGASPFPGSDPERSS